jgi:hypothetical protein
MRSLLLLLLLIPIPALAQDPFTGRGSIVDTIEGRSVSQEAAAPGAGFVAHLREAIALNRSRREDYSARSERESRCTSRRLVFLEYLTIPFAARFDRRAREFNARGIGIVRDDFISMELVRPAGTPPVYTGRATTTQRKALSARLKTYRRALKASLARSDLAGVAILTAALLDEVETLERTQGVHWAMTKHVLEQVGFATVNSIGYAEQSQGETLDLSKDLIRQLSFGISRTPHLDHKAQEAHQHGAAIVVNDVPHIPFLDRWSALLAQRPELAPVGD